MKLFNLKRKRGRPKKDEALLKGDEVEYIETAKSRKLPGRPHKIGRHLSKRKKGPQQKPDNEEADVNNDDGLY